MLTPFNRCGNFIASETASGLVNSQVPGAVNVEPVICFYPLRNIWLDAAQLV